MIYLLFEWADQSLVNTADAGEVGVGEWLENLNRQSACSRLILTILIYCRNSFELTTDVVVTSSFSFARYFLATKRSDQKERRKAYVLAAKFRAFLLSEDAARQPPAGTSYVPSHPWAYFDFQSNKPLTNFVFSVRYVPSFSFSLGFLAQARSDSLMRVAKKMPGPKIDGKKTRIRNSTVRTEKIR